eukprot:SAG31_NODE_800_length_12014_cov_11.050608_3_plen_370_part_00
MLRAAATGGALLTIATVSSAYGDTLAAPASATRKLVALDDPWAKCMDGTQSGYYFHPARTVSGKDKWILTLQGGGECVTEQNCRKKVTGALGSSKYFAPNYTFWGDSASHFIDASCTGNPVLCGYNLVYLPYCSQDLWAGMRTSVSPETFGFYFSGRHVLSAVLESLEAMADLKAASLVILTGNSAGGFGVYSNVDYVQARYPTTKVVGAPIAGYEFYAWPYQGPGHTASSLADFRASAMAGGAYNVLWNATAPLDCLSHHTADPGACLLPCYSYTAVKAPLYIVEAQSDSVVLLAHDWFPYLSWQRRSRPALDYLRAFHVNQTQCLAAAMAPHSKDGVFNPACFIHTGFTKNITIGGVNVCQCCIDLC